MEVNRDEKTIKKGKEKSPAALTMIKVVAYGMLVGHCIIVIDLIIRRLAFTT